MKNVVLLLLFLFAFSEFSTGQNTPTRKKEGTMKIRKKKKSIQSAPDDIGF